MSVVRTLIGYIKGPKGDTGATGATGAQGPAGADGAPGVNDYASTTKAGLVRVGDDFNINSSNGALSIKNAFTEASSLANINTGESQATILGKIKKFMTTLMPSNFLINTVNSTATDKALTANMGKTLAGNFATVQTSATASKAYAVGEYLVLNGKLYKVTAAIANGGTIAVGTNVSETTAGAQLKLLNENLTHRRMPGSYTEQSCYGAVGYITTSQKDAVIDVPMVWNSTMSQISLSSIKVSMRGENGYLGGTNGFDLTPYVTGVSLGRAQGVLHVTATKSDGFENTNNTCYIGSVIISYTVS